MIKEIISDRHDPETAFFWAMFATETGKQKKDCSTVTLYGNSDGEFFVVERASGALSTTYEPIEDPRKWLDEYVDKWLKPNLAK